LCGERIFRFKSPIDSDGFLSPPTFSSPTYSSPPLLPSFKMKFSSTFLCSLSLLLTSQVQAFPSFANRDLTDASGFTPFAQRDSIPDPLAGKRAPARDFSLENGKEKRDVKMVPDADHPYQKPGKNDQRS